MKWVTICFDIAFAHSVTSQVATGQWTLDNRAQIFLSFISQTKIQKYHPSLCNFFSQHQRIVLIMIDLVIVEFIILEKD